MVSLGASAAMMPPPGVRGAECPWADNAELRMPVSTPDTMWSLASRSLAVALVAGGLSACGAPPDQFAPACPGVSFLKDGADLTRFRPGGQDVTDMVLDGKLAGFQGGCAKGEKADKNDPDTVKTTLTVQMDLTRGPAAPDRTASVTFFVAATEGDRVLDEQDYAIKAAFPANIDHGTFSSQPIVLSFPVSKTKSAAAYHIYIGYRLTADELAYNRRRGTP
jgi:hypothetical protein